MNRVLAFTAIITSLSQHAWSDDPAAAVVGNGVHQDAASVDADGYKGGIPFYTAFHQRTTTRLMLLHAAKRMPELAKHLHLTDTQIQRIEDLALPDLDSLRSDYRDSILDNNAAIDEEIVDPNFYAFLDDEQRSLLDGLSLSFDGWSALSRTSVSTRIQLSGESKREVATVLTKYREDLYLPYFRHTFAAKLPPDHDYRDCEFNGRYLATLNRAIAAKLSADELKRLSEWTSRSQPPNELVEAIRRLAPLPDGLFSLHPADGG
jgi:hypothetical protein